MAKIKSLFGKKKDANTDGQEEFFKEDFAPVVVVPSSKKPEAKPAESKVKAEAAKPAAKSTPAKVSDRRYVPQPVERIINPDAGKKKTAAKPATTVKKAPATKSASSTKKETTPKSSATAKKAETKSTSTTKKATTKAASTTKKATTKTAAPAKKTTAKSKTPDKKVSTKPVKLRQEIDDSSFVKGAVAIKEGKESANGKWDIQRAKDGRFFFSLYASNHTVIAYSQIYSSTTAVTTGINSVITNAAKAETEDTTLKKIVSVPCPKWEIYIDKAEQYRFRLYAPNGLIICHSAHGYSTKGGCKGGIESIKRFASEEASVDKSYLK